jgi:pyridoxamine 5'-phosphate oxidase-like protein
MGTAARTPDQRRRDTLHRLEHDEDLWVATAGEGGPYLVPLSFRWDGETLLLSTPASSPTARNLVAGGVVRLGVGPTRDVVMIDGTVEAVEEPGPDDGDAFAAKTGFDPRTLTGYAWFRVRPVRIQAWREADEIAGRDLMRDGRWTVG